jgi:hypothetical protein
MGFKKSEPSLSFLSNGGVGKQKKSENMSFWPSFSELRWTVHRQILHSTHYHAYPSTDTQNQAILCCMRPWTLREAPKKRPIGVVSKIASHPRKSDSLGISQ